MSHCGTIFQVLGHQFFPVKSLRSRNQNNRPSYRYVLYFVILLLTITGLMLYVAINSSLNDLQKKLNAKNIMNYIVQHLIYFGCVVVISVGFIQSFLTAQLTKKFYLNSFKISGACLNEFDHCVDYREIRNRMFKYLIFLVVYLTSADVFLCLYHVFLNEPANVLGSFLITLPMVFLNITVMKFVFLVEIVNYQLKTVHQLITRTFKPHSSFACYLKPSKVNKSLGLSQKVISINRIYNVIYENAQIINRSLGITLLTLTTLNVVMILSTGYRIFLALVGQFGVEKVGGKHFLINQNWLRF